MAGEVLVPKFDQTWAVFGTHHNKTNIYAISNRIFEFLFFKKIIKQNLQKTYFSPKNEDNFLKKQKFKNPAADCADNAPVIICAKNWCNPI